MSLSPTTAVETLLDTIGNVWPTTSRNIRFGTDGYKFFSSYFTGLLDPKADTLVW